MILLSQRNPNSLFVIALFWDICIIPASYQIQNILPTKHCLHCLYKAAFEYLLAKATGHSKMDNLKYEMQSYLKNNETQIYFRFRTRMADFSDNFWSQNVPCPLYKKSRKSVIADAPVNINFHAKSGLCSSRIEWVMLNFVIWRPFCFSKFCQNLFRLSIWTSIQNLESVAQKMSELWHLVQKRTNIYLSSIFERLYSPNFISRISEVWTKEQKTQIKLIFAPAISTSYLFIR